MLCNPEDKKEKTKEMGDRKGVYVGESARSIHERAAEHWSDCTSRKEDSHMIKHWLTSHQELQEPPAFRIKVVGSFKDSMTRQVSEAVRIELRGEGVLNSKAEFSRCRLPRLVIDQEGWKKSKVQEKKMLEPVYQPPVLDDEENTTAVLAEELDLGHLADRRRKGEIGWKRRAEENNKPAKRKKYSKLVGWGEDDQEDVEQTTAMRNWLRYDEKVEEVDKIPEGWKSNMPSRKVMNKQLKQSALTFTSLLEQQVEAVEDDKSEGVQLPVLALLPEGWKETEPEAGSKKKKGKTLKKLAKENHKLDMWLKPCVKDNIVQEVSKELGDERDAPDPEDEADLERKRKANERKEYC